MPPSIRASALAVAAGLAVVTPAQALEVFTPDSKATYLRTNGDSPPAPAPLMLDLAAYGWVPGTVLQLRTAGDFDQGPGGDAVEYAIGIFSSSPTLLAHNLQVRVPDAIAAGEPFVTAPTYFGGLPTDVPQDFRFDAEGAAVVVPAGARWLMVAAYDTYYTDNSDPDGDHRYLIGLAPVPEPATWALALAGIGVLLTRRRAA